MRTVNSFKNIAVGMGGQLLTTLLQFISRAVFIRTIGLAYLGVNGLFSNVLLLLNIMELGIGSAIVFSLYKPLASGDEQKVRACMALMKRAYNIIGLCVLAAGLALLPVLPYLMKGTTDLVDINTVYLLYVAQSATSYWFFSYKGVILNADQKRYVASLVSHGVRILTVAVQIAILCLFRSFLGYVAVGVVSNVVRNLFIALAVNRRYPYMKKRCTEKLPKEERRAIFKNIYGLSLNKMSSAVLNGTDNLVISGIIGTIVVGYYSNYLMVLVAITNAAQIVFSAFTSSIGNLYAEQGKEKSEFVFRCLNFLNFWVYGFCAICLWELLPPFITVLAGEGAVFSAAVTLAIVMNFLTEGLQNAVISYRDACGLFWQGRYRPVATIFINIAVSVALAYKIGILGVILGTIVSRFVTTWWFEPKLIHKYAFGISSRGYFLRYFRSLAVICITGVAVHLITLPFAEVTAFNFVVRCAVCAVVPNAVFFLMFRKSREFKYILSAGKTIAKSIGRKGK